MFANDLAILATAAAIAFGCPAASVAQPTGQASIGTWEIEGHGGWFGASDIASGTGIETFPRGATIPSVATFTSRSVSSWLFGDGSVLLTEVYAMSGRSERITPLDAVLRQRLARREGGGSFGVRVSRQLTSRVSAEFNFDRASSPVQLVSGLEDALRTTLSSFDTVFRRQFPGGTVGSTVTIDRGDGVSQQFVTGALNVHVGTFGRVAPYLTAGMGAVFNSGDAPSATLLGFYELAALPQFVIEETDSVTLRAVAKESALVTLVGGGARLHISPRHGVRTDVRLHFARNPIHTVVDAHPERAPGGTNNAITIVVTQPTLQFASGPSPSIQSSLSGPPVTGLETFTGTGTQVQFNVSVGYFFRF